MSQYSSLQRTIFLNFHIFSIASFSCVQNLINDFSQKYQFKLKVQRNRVPANVLFFLEHYYQVPVLEKFAETSFIAFCKNDYFHIKIVCIKLCFKSSFMCLNRNNLLKKLDLKNQTGLYLLYWVYINFESHRNGSVLRRFMKCY